MGKEISKEDFDRGLANPFYGPGAEARKMLDRYGVAGTRSVKPDNRGSEPAGREHRELDEVKRDLSAAMMNDYDTRRGMEAAALLGNKDAKKYATKGFNSSTKSLMGGWNTMKALKKEYAGGGGMSGPENEAGLTHALVSADRDALTKKFTAMSAEDQTKNAKVSKDTDFSTAPSPEVQAAKERVAAYQASNRGTEPSPYGNYAQRSTKFF